MNDRFERLRMMYGDDALKKLFDAKVLLFGLGGVGSYTFEALLRSGVGNICVVDGDSYSESNINRQLYATLSSVGKMKTAVAKERALDINPCAKIAEKPFFATVEGLSEFDFSSFDYIIDAIDDVKVKIAIAEKASQCETPVICALGAGNKENPQDFAVSDIYKTDVCPLAKIMRRELRKRGVKKLKTVFSKEEPMTPIFQASDGKRHTPASNAFTPSVMGLIIGGEVIKDLIRN